MDVLSLLNVSNVDDIQRDSGLILQLIYGAALAERGVDFALIGPDVPSFRELDLRWATKIVAPLGVSKYQVRYHFDWPALERIVLERQPDVIFNNQIELGSGLRGILATNGLSQVRLVSYCHYIPVLAVNAAERSVVLDPSLNQAGLCAPILMQLCGSVLASDIVLVQSEFARRLLTDIGALFGLGDDFRRRVRCLPPPLDPTLVRAAHARAPIERRVFYNHRLYSHYGTSQVIDFVDQIQQRTDLEFEVSDVTPRRSSLRIRMDPSVSQNRETIAGLPYARLTQGGGHRPTYRTMIERARVSVAPFRPSCVWSMAALDCMGMGVPVVAPAYAAYPEFTPSSLCFREPAEGMEIVERLLVDDDFWLQASRECQLAAARFHPDNLAEALLAELSPAEELKSDVSGALSFGRDTAGAAEFQIEMG